MDEISLKTKLEIIDNLRKELDYLQQITKVFPRSYFNIIIPDINRLIKSRIDQIKKELEYYFNDIK